MSRYEIPDELVTAVCHTGDSDNLVEALETLVGGAKSCAKCGGTFYRRQARTVGVMYCSQSCARAQAQRAYRARQKA